MFLIEFLLVIIGVYIAPAIALKPTLIVSSRLFIAIPFVSVVVVLVLYTPLSLFGLFKPLHVQLLCGAMALIAAYRVIRLVSSKQLAWEWSTATKLLLAVNIVLAVYLAMNLMRHAFSLNDEIYSWNMWAIRHYLGHDIEFYYTRAPYPQLFSKLLAFSYMLLGSIDAQTAVKGALVIFPLAILCALSSFAVSTSHMHIVAHTLLALVLGVVLRKIFAAGMPDAMVAAAIVCSACLILHALDENKKIEAVLLAAVCACVGALTKQPGLLWAIFSFPAIAVLWCLQRKLPWSACAIAVAPVMTAVVWMLTEGAGFQDNPGVTNRSFADRGLLDQIGFSFEKYFLGEPALLLFVLFATYCVFRRKQGRGVFWFYVLPGIGAWFLYAAYDLRAGASAVAVLALLVAYSNFSFDSNETSFINKWGPANALFSGALLSILSLIVVAASVTAINDLKDDFPAYKFGNAKLNKLYRVFGEGSPVVYNAIHSQKDMLLWTPTNYVYGLFYGSVSVIRPGHLDGYTASDLMSELQEHRPDYLTNSGKLNYGPGGNVLDKLAQTQCPDLFEHISGPSKKYQVSLYRLDKEQLDSGNCHPK